jgi:outer membrane lipoprotein LolB
MFSWLNGQPLSAGGWIAQLADLPRGRLQARRDTPDPAAEIRIILDEPSD